MCAHYGCGRKTKRWPLCVFYGMINAGVINSWIIHNENAMKRGENQMQRRPYMQALALALIKPWAEQRLPSSNLSRQLGVLICSVLDIPTTGTLEDEQVVKPVVSVYPAASRAHLEGNSSLLCVASAMFPPLVQFSWKRQKKNGREAEELPPAEGEQLELRESGRTIAIRMVDGSDSHTYKYSCWVKHEGGTVEAQTQQEVPAPAASCPPEREPADLPALQPADLSFQSQCRVKLLCLLYTVLIVKSLVYCCGLSLLMILTNKGPSTNCTHAD
ncbi:unnamed protein product [Oreochromis niloticus]|nr:unnamed protein product [Mustela putorius furo]